MNSLVGARKRRRRRRRRLVVVSVSASSLLLLLLLLLPALHVPPVADASVRVISGVAGNAMPDRSVLLDAENCEQQRGSDAENASNCDDDDGGTVGSDDRVDGNTVVPPAEASFESLPATFGLGRTFEDGVRYGANLFLPPLRITGARRKGGGRKYRVGGRDDEGEKGADENVEEDYDPYFCREEEDEDDSERGGGCEEDDGDEDDENRNVPERRRRKRRILRTHSTGGGGESSSGAREKYYKFGGGGTEAEGATTTSGHRSNDDVVTNRDDDNVLPRTTLPVALLVKRGGCTFESKARRAARLNDELVERQRRQLTDNINPNINDNDDGTTGNGDGRSSVPGPMPTPRVRYLVVYNNETETADDSDDDDDDDDGLVAMGREYRHRIDDDGESATDLDDIGMQFVSRATGTDLLRRIRERSEELWPVKFGERKGHRSRDAAGEGHADREKYPLLERTATSAAAATAMHFAQHSEWYFPILLDSEVRPPERRIGGIGGAGAGISGSVTAGSSGDDEGTTRRPSNATTDQRQQQRQQHATTTTTTTTFIPWLWITSQVLLCSLFLYLFVNAAFVWYELGGRIRLERRRRRGADDRWYVPPVTLRIVRARGRIFWATPQSMLHVAAARRERRKRRMTLTEQQVLDLPEMVFGPDMRRMRFDIVETADDEEEEEETGNNGGTRRRGRSPPLAIVSDGDDGADADASNDGNDGFDDGRAASDRGNGGEDARAETGTAVPANEEEEAPSQVHDDDGGSGGDRRHLHDGQGAEERDDERRQRQQQQQLWACQRSCSVCLEDFTDGEVVRVLVPCSHVFHTDCILPWLTKKRGTCPLCQQYVWRRRRDADGNPVNASDLALPTRRIGGSDRGVGGERGAGASDEEAAGDGGGDEDEDEDEGSAAAPAVVTAAEFAPEEEEEDEWEATLTSLSYDDDDEVDDDDDDDEENERSQRRAQDARPLPHMPPTM